jgi:hypothetical protein
MLKTTPEMLDEVVGKIKAIDIAIPPTNGHSGAVEDEAVIEETVPVA